MKHSVGVRAGLALLLSTIMGVGLLPVAATAQDSDCPEVMPVDDLRDGMTGHGLTVADGDQTSTFDVEILGVLENGLGPGRDLVVVETSGEVLEKPEGIWFGMSGSPVYVDDKIVGAVAFGLSFGPSKIAGVTPAEEMVRIFDYTNDPEASEAPSTPRRVPLTPTMRRRVARATRTPAGEVGNSLVQLKVPVSISGLPGRAMDRVQEVVQRERLPIVPHVGPAATGAPAGADTPALHAGDNIVAALSYGDVSYAGLGTTTMVCDGRALIFGHPFFWQGNTTLGANRSETITIVDDSVFGPYELGTIEEGIGIVDQDRFAGLRAVLGSAPPRIPITSSIEATETGRSRDGRTEVLISEMVPFLTWSHIYSNILMSLDEYTEGSSSASWTISGTRESGATWQLSRNNLYTSDYDIADQSSWELLLYLYGLYYNDFEDVEFTSIDFDASVDDDVNEYKVVEVQVSTDGRRFEERRRVHWTPGGRLFMRVRMEASDDSADPVVDLELKLPRRLRRGGLIEISGGNSGGSGEFCLYDPSECVDEQGNKLDSFDKLITFLQSRPTGNELLARLSGSRRGKVKALDSEVLDRVVTGRRRIRIIGPRGRSVRGRGVPVAEGGGGH